MQPVVEGLHTNGLGSTLGDWELWTMITAGLLGFYLQQVSLATGKLVTSVATVSVVNPIVSVALGTLVLQSDWTRTHSGTCSEPSAPSRSH